MTCPAGLVNDVFWARFNQAHLFMAASCGPYKFKG
jgi:hypothetical protein